MSEALCVKPQEDYEDDFEKDLDWLIGEDQASHPSLTPRFPEAAEPLARVELPELARVRVWI